MGAADARHRRRDTVAEAWRVALAGPGRDAHRRHGGACRRDRRGDSSGVQPTRPPGRAREPLEYRPGRAPGRVCAQKKRRRPSEVDRPDIHAKRAAFLRWVRTIDPARLVVLDEAGANLAMGRSHAWVLRGQEYVEPRPMNWGENLTLIGAIRRTGWVTLNTKWRAVNTRFFVEWVRRRLAPRLRPHDIVLLDNLKAHKAPDVRRLVEARGATLRYLPPYSHDFSPIEPAWGLVKRHIRTHAPRTGSALRRVAQRARHVVHAHHCRQWFVHAGYVN